ncbi:MAG: PAS domain S-box protein [Planctomycetes bacterium]|nr:PAS domain S-box protein [Planctomycetota bacterium]
MPHDFAELAQVLFADSADALLLFDVQSGSIQDANPAAQRLIGASRAALAGSKVGALIQCARTGAALDFSDEQRYHDASCGQESLLLVSPAGMRIPIHCSLTPLSASQPLLGLLRLHSLRDPPREEQLDAPGRISEKHYRDLVETSNDLIWSMDLEGRWTFVNRKALLAICGYEPEDLLGKPVRAFLAPERVEGDLRIADRILRGESVYHHETVLLRRDGARVHVRVNAIPWLHSDGATIGITGTATDVTRYKETEAALIASRKRFEAFMNHIPALGFVKDADGRMVYVNQAYTTKFETNEAHFIGKLDHELWPAEVADRLRDADRRVLDEMKPIELHEVVPTPDGVYREWWVAKFPFRDAAGRIFLGGIVLDLTERKQLEDALRRSEQRHRQVWERNLAGNFRIAADGRILDCNDSFARLFGFHSRADALNRSTTEFYFDLRVRDEFLTSLRESQFLANYEIRMRRADGTPIWVLENVSLLEEGGEEILEGSLFDITPRKHIEQALRASENNYRTLINHLNQAIFLKNRDLRYVTVNQVFCAGVRKTEAEILNKTIGELFTENAVTEKARDVETHVLATGRALEIEDVITVHGEPRHVRVHRTPVKDADGAVTGVLGIAWDVTQQREMEAQLRHVDKMNAIGQLAGGLAHDFNNLLTIVLGNLSVVMSQHGDWDSSQDLLHNAEQAGLRAAELTQTLLGLSRRTALAAVPCNLNQNIDEVVRLTRSVLPANIQVEFQADPNLGPVLADPGQINQVLTNLTLNARDAMAAGGVLRFETCHFVPDAEYLAGNVEARPGDYVRLRVQDTGPGVPSEIKQRIFEPFFTTKPPGKGTGLGLAIVFSILKQHQGWVVCESLPDRGTVFDLFLPRCPAAPAVEDKPVARAVHNDLILIVDDEPLIRNLARIILTRAGYETLLAENGAEALDLIRQRPGQIALIVLDAVMPRLSGRETLRELGELAPEIHVLFSSGYSTEQMALREFPQVRAFLPKPYRAEQLTQKVAEILDAARRETNQPVRAKGMAR